MTIKKDKIILLLGIFSVILIFFILIFNTLPLERREMGVRFMIGNPPAFDLNSSELIFGRIPPGGSSVRKVNLSSPYNFTIRVDSYFEGNAAPFLNVGSPIYVAPNNSTTISVNVNIPTGADFGNYTGKIIFEIRRK